MKDDEYRVPETGREDVDPRLSLIWEYMRNWGCRNGVHKMEIMTSGKSLGLPDRDQCVYCGYWEALKTDEQTND